MGDWEIGRWEGTRVDRGCQLTGLNNDTNTDEHKEREWTHIESGRIPRTFFTACALSCSRLTPPVMLGMLQVLIMTHSSSSSSYVN